MRINKRLGVHFTVFILSRLSYLILNLLFKSYRLKEVGKENKPQGSYLLACWHEQLLATSFAQVGEPFRPIVSKSFAGKIISYVFEKFSFVPIRGSQKKGTRDKGGSIARQQLVQACIDGYPCAFTVDGSTGPRRKVKPGVVDVARKSGSKIIPVAAVSSKFWQLKTWDKFKIPKPFSTISLVYDKPIQVNKNTSGDEFDKLTEEIENKINKMEKIALENLS